MKRHVDGPVGAVGEAGDGDAPLEADGGVELLVPVDEGAPGFGLNQWVALEERVTQDSGTDAQSARSPQGGQSGWSTRWPSFPPRGYLGQLSPAFQRQLRAARGELTVADADWYHTFELPDGELIRGAWDLRGGEDAYLGHTELAGKRVLELGPATGYFTFWMGQEGADVVAVEGGFDVPNDVLCTDGGYTSSAQSDIMNHVYRVQNGWWYIHDRLGSNAKLVHGNIYDLPGDLGVFDVSVFGAILLHLRDPYTAIGEAARRTSQRIVVTDLLQDVEEDPTSNVMRFAPLRPHEITNWWSISPGAVVAILGRYGFHTCTVTFHSQRHHLGHDLSVEPVEMPMFTVAADRGGTPRATGRG